MRHHRWTILLAALAGCGSGTANPDARVFDSGGIDAVPGSPTVIATSPADQASAAPIVPTISVTFSEPMDPTTIGVNTGDDECSGSLQVSSDGFGSCVQMTGQPTSSDDTTFEVVPTAELLSATYYEIRVTTAATDAAGNPMAARFETGRGFQVRFYHHVVIDGVIDFSTVTDRFETLSGDDSTFIWVSHDDDNVYVGLEAGAVANPGSGDRYLSFSFSTDPDLATGNTRSSDGHVKFGAPGTKRMAYEWRERIDGGNSTEFRIGNAGGWSDWGTANKEVSKTAGYIEARIARSELGNPSHLLVTTFAVSHSVDEYLVDHYSVSYLLDPATGGDATDNPVDARRYIDLELPSSQPPNHASHLANF